MNTDIQEFITAARTCIHQLLENAAYVRHELPNVGLPDPLRLDVDELCDKWLEAKHEALTDLHELAEAADTDASDDSALTNRWQQIEGILGSVFEPTDRVVRQLREAAFENPRLGLAVMLVMESARNIIVTLPAFVRTDEFSVEHHIRTPHRP